MTARQSNFPEPELVAIGPHFAVAPVGAGAPGSALARAVSGVRALPSALVVVVAAADASPALRAALPELRRAAAERRAATLVLAASGLAAGADRPGADPDGGCPAQQIAARLGIPVTAPDGPVSIQPDGTLLVTPVPGTGRAAWWLCPPQGTPQRLPSTWPPPPAPDETDAPGAPTPAAVGTGAAARPSTPGEREAFASLLGERFSRLSRQTDPVATRLPHLRALPGAELKPDLAAVLLYRDDSGFPASRAELADAARSHPTGPLGAYLACVASGLRRLPVHHGPVLLGAGTDAALAGLPPGTVRREPAPVAGLASNRHELSSAVELAVWSSTARRTSVLAEPPSAQPDVAFPPGTLFTVLAVLPAADGVPARVLLRDLADPDAPDAARHDRRALDRLRAWLDQRDRADPAGRLALPRPQAFHWP